MPQVLHKRVKAEIMIVSLSFLAVNIALAISNGIIFLQNLGMLTTLFLFTLLILICVCLSFSCFSLTGGMDDCPEITNYVRTVALACTIMVCLLGLAWRGYITTFFIAVLCFCGVAYSVVVVSNVGTWLCPQHPPLRIMALVDVTVHGLGLSWFFVLRRNMGVAS